MESEKKNLIAAGFMFLLAGFVIYLTVTQFVTEQAVGGGPFANSAFYPQVIAGVIIFLSVILAVSTIIKKKRAAQQQQHPFTEDAPVSEEQTIPAEVPEPEGEGVPPVDVEDKPSKLMILMVAAVLVVYTILLELLGYWFMTPIFMVILFRMLKVKNWISTIVLALASTAVLYLFFSEILEVVLPYGRLGLFG